MTLHPLVTTLAPELILVVAASIMVVLGAGRSNGQSAPAIGLLAIAAAVLAAGRVALSEAPAGLIVDPVTGYARFIVLAVGAVILLVNRHVPAGPQRGEFFALLLFSLAGAMLVAAADDLILFFLALELVSIPTYILVALSRNDLRASEAGVKYFFLGSFAAASLLYGLSFLYGMTGTTTLFGNGASDANAARLASAAAQADPLAVVGLLLVIAGLAFKLAAVPMHFYAPDVYQGAAAPVAGLLGFVPKLAGLIGLIRVLSLVGWNLSPALFWLLWVLAAATMTVGNVTALLQSNARRMLAYSSIAHSGYLLLAILAGPGDGDAAPTRNGVSAALFYIAVYGLMNLGAFAALAFFRREADGQPIEDVEDLAGAARRHPAASLALAICALSLMGMPPTGGFLGKVYLFSSAIASSGQAGRGSALLVLVVIAVVNAAIAAAYYLRLIATCYLRPAPQRDAGHTRCHALEAGLAVCAAAMLVFFVAPRLLSAPAGWAGRAVPVAARAQNAFADPAASPRPAAQRVP
ncbi:MAG: NADH-quinone oxidoreductase subunit N [Phycisphaerae bacterium]